VTQRRRDGSALAQLEAVVERAHRELREALIRKLRD
jgi:uncharacterized protein YfdQ (DUF2303 family)